MIDYFIICHDTNLINKFKTSDKFPNIKYLIVGNNSTNSINENYIICNKLIDNIEQYPYLCSYTAWYAVIANKLNNYDNICLLEYDTIVDDSFDRINRNIINHYKNNYIIAYSKTLTNHYVFSKSTPWLEISLKKIYDINLIEFIDKIKDKYPYWPTTTNIITNFTILESFKNWFDPMTKLFAHDKLGSYVQERAFFVYCVLNNVDIIYAPPKTLIHHQLQSHRSNDVYGEFLSSKNTKILDPRMISEFDTLYDLHKNRIIYNS